MKLSKELIFTPERLEFSAWTGHIPFAAWLIQVLKPKVFVELGSHSGNSYFAFCQAVAQAQLSTCCQAVDTWRGDEHAGRYGEAIFRSVSKHNERYSSFSTLLRMTFDQALDQHGDGTIDLLHIDGLHTYEAVRHDFKSWKPKLTDRAVVLFHDTEVREKGFGVWQLWEELSRDYPTFSFTHSHGLGVLFYGRQIQNELKTTLLNASPEEIELTRDFFAHLGSQLDLITQYKFKPQKSVRYFAKKLIRLPRELLRRPAV